LPFNGSGTFVRVRNWVQDATAGIRIRADRHDSEDDNFANGLSQCITKDGQTTLTANLPMAGFRHTNAGAAQNATEYARYDQVQLGKAVWAIAGGTADALTALYSPNTMAPVDGQLYWVRATAANATTTPTFSPDADTPRVIVKYGNDPLAAGDINGAGHELILRYRASDTKYELLNPFVNTPPTPNAAAISVNNAGFTVLTGTDVQAVLDSADDFADSTINGKGPAVVGNSRNVRMVQATAAATATFTADQIVMFVTLGGASIKKDSFSQVLNLATTGAGGMDVGLAPVSGYVSIYAISQPNGTTNILACNETTSNAEIYSGANMPSGYTYSALIGVYPTDVSRFFVQGQLINRSVSRSPVNVRSTATGNATTFTAQSISTAVPLKAKFCSGSIGAESNNNNTFCVAADANGTGAQCVSLPTTPVAGASINGWSIGAVCVTFGPVMITSPQNIFYASASATYSVRIQITGYDF